MVKTNHADVALILVILFTLSVLACSPPFYQMGITQLSNIPMPGNWSVSVIAGQIVDSRSNYLMNGQVFLFTSDGKKVRGAFTDSEGRFEFNNLSQGDYIVKLRTQWCPGTKSATIHIPPNSKVIITLQFPCYDADYPGMTQDFPPNILYNSTESGISTTSTEDGVPRVKHY